MSDSRPPMHQQEQAIRPVSGMKYGENKAVNDLQAAAPMSGSAQAAVAPPQAAMPAPHQVSPFDAPTAQPETPVTDGAPLGPGANSAPGPTLYEQSAARYAPTLIPYLQNVVDRGDAPQEIRDMLFTMRAVVNGGKYLAKK